MFKGLFFCLTLISTATYAQSDVVTWQFNAKKLADKTYEIKLIASIKTPWHIYSTTQPEGGPLPTMFTFAKNPLLTVDGDVKEEGKLVTHYEEVFEIDTKYFENKVEFVQKVRLKSNAKTKVTGTVQYMACTSKECLPPAEVPFSVSLN